LNLIFVQNYVYYDGHFDNEHNKVATAN